MYYRDSILLKIKSLVACEGRVDQKQIINFCFVQPYTGDIANYKLIFLSYASVENPVLTVHY